MVEFNLSGYLTRFQSSDKRSFPPVENPSNELNTVIDRLAVSAEQIDADEETWDLLVDLCHGFAHLSDKLKSQLSYLIMSSMSNLSTEIETNLHHNFGQMELVDLLPQWRIHLEEYGYLIYVILCFLQEDIHIATTQTTNLGRSGSKRLNAKSGPVELFKRTCIQLESMCEIILKILNIDLSKLFQTTAEKNMFIELFTKPLYLLIEIEPVVKVTSLKLLIQRIISMSVKYHNQEPSAENAIMTNLTYFLHLSNFNAELLQTLNDIYDYPQLTEEVLRDISSRVFNSKDSTGPKAISNFLIKLSELSPQVMLRQMSLVIRLLNNSSITLRCSVVEACGNIIIGLANDSEQMDHYKQQILVLLELLEERFLDSNPYVRTKAIQGCIKICDVNSKFNKNRSKFAKLAVSSLQDKSSLVRRNTVKLLSKVLLKHPFGAMHGTQLKLSTWQKYHASAQMKLKDYCKANWKLGTLEDAVEYSSRQDDQEDQEKDNEISDGSGTDDSEFKNSHLYGDELENEHQLHKFQKESEVSNSTDRNVILKLKLLIVYYEDAIQFIKDIHVSLELAANLLFSRNRNEVLETMDYFVLADAYGLEPSILGVKKMLHLIWMKGTNDEGTNISSHLVNCYKQLFLTAPDEFNYRERAAFIARNLIQLTIGASIADIASLEQLMIMMYNERLIDEEVINILWSIYSSAGSERKQAEKFSQKQYHGSVIILGMISLANHEIALRGLDFLLNVGLGETGDHDLVLCRYSCLALERMIPKNHSVFTPLTTEDRESEVVKKLYSKLVAYTTDLECYPMLEQALNALFTISSRPDIIATELIREKTMITFGKVEGDDSINGPPISRIVSLSQLLFLVGQVAIKTLVYLESCEAEFKKRKIAAETRQSKEKENNKQQENSINDTHDTELEMIGGSNEDDFTDAIIFIKEKELLFGENSLLNKFCPVVEEIVSNYARFGDLMLQRTATLCLEKFMCVSSSYCAKSLPLLITVMEKSSDPIIRSNAVLGLGDMAVCFNNLVDENTDYLYRRLHDDNLMVQRTCLMTVTFLILAGQVKVKGQLGQMAKCLENQDQGVSDMCRLFFTELATKDNAIYNGFIDIFSNLSADEDLNKDGFKRIMKFLLSFVDKEKHQKQLTEKLLGRLSKCETQKQWNDIAFVLNTLPYKNEKVTTALEEGFKIVRATE
ncbi:condensin complex subunit [Zygosaccharomyces mellis]|uniref:Condensin complex subunit 1 n=1 Tax=Zygosaccharomyces mellis TaxID=42258 RepID=A0A4C2E1Y1_9SACH|nr:condensin complex subunit [Zygosaccharomyces mellis]